MASICHEDACTALINAAKNPDPAVALDISDGLAGFSSPGQDWTYDNEGFITFYFQNREQLPKTAEDRCAVARLLLRLGKKAEPAVKEELDEALATSPDHPAAVFLHGLLTLRQAERAEDEQSRETLGNQAAVEFQRVGELNSADPEPLYAIACLPHIGYEDRREVYEKALSRDTTQCGAYGDYHYQYAIYVAKERARGLSADAFTRALLVDPECHIYPNPHVADGRAQEYFRLAVEQAEQFSEPEAMRSLWSV
jgi:hypothetical protein